MAPLLAAAAAVAVLLVGVAAALLALAPLHAAQPRRPVVVALALPRAPVPRPLSSSEPASRQPPRPSSCSRRSHSSTQCRLLCWSPWRLHASTQRLQSSPSCSRRRSHASTQRRLLPWSPWRSHCVLQLQGHRSPSSPSCSRRLPWSWWRSHCVRHEQGHRLLPSSSVAAALHHAALLLPPVPSVAALAPLSALAPALVLFLILILATVVALAHALGHPPRLVLVAARASAPALAPPGAAERVRVLVLVLPSLPALALALRLPPRVLLILPPTPFPAPREATRHLPHGAEEICQEEGQGFRRCRIHSRRVVVAK
ncbi:hypothetical protein PVAP13_8NG112802 [Panicum virgatum]|uniref:Uncharacterized protein n=1 Tax=Panicum virgatum TaxID=38727 RepID=A0A8T0PBS0_PANVG|nr:hypothetical protein PVAP13_8NG112802 [Panicum virgatum]